MTTFINPIPNSYLTSKFGLRKINKGDGKGLVDDWHQGVDLARQPNSNVEVLAAADGEVYRVGTLGTYGKIVMIRHTVNGKRMDTNYAHLASHNVKVGDKVKQGQKIGIMGNTGVGTGPHLHFEIHNGPWVSGQKNAIDPSKYIQFYSKGELVKMEKRINELEAEVKALKKSLSNLIGTIEKTAVYTSSEKASDYAFGALKWATDVGILKGDGNGNLNPHGALKRQDMALMLHRYHDKVTR